jgi:hypothetical protein
VLTAVSGDSPINTPWMGLKRLVRPSRTSTVRSQSAV